MLVVGGLTIEKIQRLVPKKRKKKLHRDSTFFLLYSYYCFVSSLVRHLAHKKGYDVFGRGFASAILRTDVGVSLRRIHGLWWW